MGDQIPGQYKSRRGGETVGVLKLSSDARPTHTGNPSPLRDSWELGTPRLHILFSPNNHLKKNTKCTNKIGKKHLGLHVGKTKDGWNDGRI